MWRRNNQGFDVPAVDFRQIVGNTFEIRAELHDSILVGINQVNFRSFMLHQLPTNRAVATKLNKNLFRKPDRS